LCDHPASFFAQLPAHAYSDFVVGGSCVKCKHPVAVHLAQPTLPVASAAPVSGPDALVRNGPLISHRAPEDLLRDVLSSWRCASFLESDRVQVESDCSSILTIMFSGAPNVVLGGVLGHGSSISRSWSYCDSLDLDAQVALSASLERVKTLGRCVLSLFRSSARYRWLGVPKEDVKVMRWQNCVSAEVSLLESVLRSTIETPIGQILPDSYYFSSPKFSLWWGILAATLPVHILRRHLENTWRDYFDAWLNTHGGDVCEIATWKMKYSGASRGSSRYPAKSESRPGDGKPHPGRKRRRRGRQDSITQNSTVAGSQPDQNVDRPQQAAPAGGDGSFRRPAGRGSGAPFRGGHGGGRGRGQDSVASTASPQC
jgi:hypothetical protein